MIEFRMPRVSLSEDDEMVIAQWLVAEGDHVAEGDAVLEVETAKANMEVEAPTSGTIIAQLRTVGDRVGQGEVIAMIGMPGDIEEVDAVRAAHTRQNGSKPGEPELAAAIVGAGASHDPVHPGAGAPSSPRRRPSEAAGPAARLLAETDLDAGGALLGLVEAPVRARAHSHPGVSPVTAHEGTRVPLSRHRQALARLMTQSAALPQFSVSRALPMDRAMTVVSALRSHHVHATVTDIVVWATSRALLAHPEMNGHIVDSSVIRFPDPAISLATDGPSGLIAPVLHRVHEMTWNEISRERRRIVDGARRGHLAPTDLSGGTFSVSNVGPLGGDTVVPLVTPPQIAVLGLGRVTDAWGGQSAVAALAADHRAVDGADAARFLGTLADLLAEVDIDSAPATADHA